MKIHFFEGTAEKFDRSTMNATFKLTDESLSDAFNEMQNAGISGLKGHRSVGGYRASMYNALPLKSVQVLVDVMKEFGKNTDKMKILANDGLAAEGVKALEAAGFEVSTEKIEQEELINYINTESIEMILIEVQLRFEKEIIDACPGLKLIGRGGVGMDNIDVDYARSKGLKVINTPAASSQSVAELVIAHLFGICRFLYDANRNMPSKGDTEFSSLKKSYSKGIELRGKTLGIVGFGRIDNSVARYALGLGMKVVAYDAIPMTKEIYIDFADATPVKIGIHTKDIVTCFNRE